MYSESTMRGARKPLLAGILVLLGLLGATYYYQQQTLARAPERRPAPLPMDVQAAARDWVFTQTEANRPVVEIRAKDFRQVSEPAHIELKGVELRLFDANGLTYDRVNSASAEFDQTAGQLYSDGAVEITLDVPAGQAPKGRLVSIQSSGVRFDTKTGRATTDRFTRFRFEAGGGESTGATYDPATRELRLHRHARIEWTGAAPAGAPTVVEAAEVLYRETESRVHLRQWSRLRRANTIIEGGDATVVLEEGVIRMVEADKARGKDSYPNRQIEYEAEKLYAQLSPGMQFEKVTGERNARLISTSDTARTTITSDRIELRLKPLESESELEEAMALGHSRIEMRAGEKTPPERAETRILTSEAIVLKMRPGGQDISLLETHAPGKIEFIPAAATRPRREMAAERLTFHYAPDNRLERLNAYRVTTRTEPPLVKPQDAPAPATTTASKEFVAHFDPDTGEMVRLEQWDGFQYQEGARRATAYRGEMDAARNLFLLTGQARVWDESGTLAAHHIRMDRVTGDTVAEGDVSATRAPEKRDRIQQQSGLFSSQQALQSRSQRLVTGERNRRILYEGGAVLWQGANRLQAETVEIEREKGLLAASGNVDTLFQEEGRPSAPNGTPPSPPAPPSRAGEFVRVKSQGLTYSDESGVAHYSGGVWLTRGSLEVRARELRAHFVKTEQESRLDSAFADGNVQIARSGPGFTRTGSAEHAEYYSEEEKTVLHGGNPVIQDSRRGVTSGSRLTHYAKEDKLLAAGAAPEPAVTRILRK